MDKIAEFYKALGDKTRLQILKMLSTKEMCVNEISDRICFGVWFQTAAGKTAKRPNDDRHGPFRQPCGGSQNYRPDAPHETR
uniref:ArsR family transcriptional regulator n=1 Tax=Desulforadius tongensis TaxID=1216062 RepID=UPI003B75CCA6